MRYHITLIQFNKSYCNRGKYSFPIPSFLLLKVSMWVLNLVIFLRIFIRFLSFFPSHQVLNPYWYILKWPSLFKILNHIFNIFISSEPISYITFVAAEICGLFFTLKILPTIVIYMLGLNVWNK